jgi:hypothetical protein
MNARVVDFNGLLQANLKRVFGERDATKRHAAIRELYAPDAVLYEPDDIATGHAAIAHAVDALSVRESEQPRASDDRQQCRGPR